METIKATELRIGNYITDKTGKVQKITPSLMIAIIEGVIDFGQYIPLTEDWLLKFGFEHERSGPESGSFTIKTLNGVYFEFDSDFIGHSDELICGDYDECIHIRLPKYIHRLQNLYFDLKGEELDS